MEYNTTREQMIIPEYGRNIQEMIHYCCTIGDREKRNQAAKFIVNVMAQMHPQVRDSVDFKHKLWDHLYIIADFKLEVDSPYPPPPPLTLSTKPEHLSYHDKEIEYRHYGKNIALIIEKAIAYPEGPEKEALVRAIAIHLKKSYLNWNRESVTDDLIEEHLSKLSGKKLKFHEDINLTATNDLLARNKPKKTFRPKNNGGMQGPRGRKKQP
ncbi:MAG TPA: DUF4290 domain-containing protein [Bacteroidales bacterium]|nr:DUF4290 domain-containing protein [Bacteroidales bacterium]